MKIDILEAFQHLKQQAGFGQSPNRVVEVKFLQHVAHVLAEAGDVVAQIRSEIRRVREQLLEVVSRRVEEGEARGGSELRIEILQPSMQLRVLLQHALFCRCKHTIKPTQHCERKDDIL